MSDIPRNLREQLRRRNVIPFVGAGVSRGVQNRDGVLPLFPDWNTLLQKIYEELLDQKHIKSAQKLGELLASQPINYFEAAEIGWKHLSTPNCRSFLMEMFDVSVDAAQPESLALARSIWNLGNLIFTTNYDPVLEWVCPKPGDLRVLCRQVSGLSQMLRHAGENRPTIWHLHGNVLNDVENIVFTRSQYNDFYRNNRWEGAYNALRTFLSTKTILFIGFSLNDAYFVQNMIDVDRMFNGAASSYYVLVKRGTRIDPSISQMVMPVEVDDFESLPKLIREMGSIADPRAAIVHWGGRQRRVAAAAMATLLLAFHANDQGRLRNVALSKALESSKASGLKENTGDSNTAPADSPAGKSTKVVGNQISKNLGRRKYPRNSRVSPNLTEEELIERARKESGSTISNSQ